MLRLALVEPKREELFFGVHSRTLVFRANAGKRVMRFFGVTRPGKKRTTKMKRLNPRPWVNNTRQPECNSPTI